MTTQVHSLQILGWKWIAVASPLGNIYEHKKFYSAGSKLERLARDKRFSLLAWRVSVEEKDIIVPLKPVCSKNWRSQLRAQYPRTCSTTPAPSSNYFYTS
jgi:hypothetical protein